jgi:hypothetical protein
MRCLAPTRHAGNGRDNDKWPIWRAQIQSRPAHGNDFNGSDYGAFCSPCEIAPIGSFQFALFLAQAGFDVLHYALSKRRLAKLTGKDAYGTLFARIPRDSPSNCISECIVWEHLTFLTLGSSYDACIVQAPTMSNDDNLATAAFHNHRRHNLGIAHSKKDHATAGTLVVQSLRIAVPACSI